MIDLKKLVALPGRAPRPGQIATPFYPGAKPAVDSSPDLDRIIALPRRPLPSGLTADALIAMATERFALPRRPCRCAVILAERRQPPRPCLETLRLAQAWALYEIGVCHGLIAPIGVGHGKTLIDILAPLALGLDHTQTAVLLIPPTLVDQLLREYELVEQHFRTPSLVIHNGPRVMKAGMPALVVVPYSRLSRPEATALLEALRPDAIIADECHKLRHAGTATTSRVLRYFGAHPSTSLCAWTGSLTDASVKDYAHLAALALGHASPVPIDPMVVEDWSRAIDAGDFPAPPGALLRLCEPGQHVREGFQRRFLETEGVVSTSTAAVDAELVIEERPAPPIPDEITEALDGVRSTWTRPDGEELIDALSVARCTHELAAGFFYRWIFPRGESPDLIAEWLDARKLWRKEMRQVLNARQNHLDSPFLVTCAAMRAHGDLPASEHLPAWRSRMWPRWRDIKDRVQPETQAVRVHDYLARDAADWASATLGIVWYAHRAFGEWVGEISGLPVHAGGPDAGQKIAAETGERSVICSIKSHGTGRDGLQRLFWQQLVACPPSKNEDWAQMLGRLHRIGQASPVVRAEFYRHTPELKKHVDSALERALYAEQTLGEVQKIRCGWRG